ncbi:MAG: PHB depolymerase family esterase [Gemmataceae bacterium]
MTHFLLVTTFLLGGETEPLRPGFHTRSVEHDGVKRSYLLHVPKGYDASKATPLVLALHGATMNGSTMALFSGMNETGDKHTFVSVYPNGTGLVSTWNAGQFPGALGAKKVDDVGYLAKVLDDVEKTLNIDKKRVYACGMSNGGMMCYRLASEMSERIAAIAPVAGTLALEKIESKRPISVLHFHGTKDGLVPYEGPKVDAKLFMFKGVEGSLKPFIALDGCAEKGEMTEVPSKDEKLKIERFHWGTGKQKTEVILYKIEGGGHTWPGRRTNPPFLGGVALDLDANELIWEFFQRHPLR